MYLEHQSRSLIVEQLVAVPGGLVSQVAEAGTPEAASAAFHRLLYLS